MKHFDIWQWADYVRGLADDTHRSAMDAHLSSGCARCARTASTFRSMAAIADGEAGREPPEHAIRYAQAVYSLFRPATTSFPRLLARLVHDSLREPLPAGIRAQARLSRHALYEAGSYYLDLQVDMQQHKAKAGDILILCSDGLTTMIPDEDIARVVREAGGDVEKAAQALVASANAKGGEDNITVLLIRFDD